MLSPHPRNPPSDARALYLSGMGKKRVTCTDAALVVTNEHAQTYRYPIGRLARVVTTPAADWSGGAIALCLRHGIGITWMDAGRETLGTSYPTWRDNTDCATALELMLQSPSGQQRYDHWLRARRMDTLTRLAAAHTPNFAPAQWETLKREWVYANQHTTHLPPSMRALCLAHVNSQLSAHRLPPVFWGASVERIDLDQDLCALMWAEMNLGTGDLANHVEQGHAITELTERWLTQNRCTLEVHLNTLQRTALKALHE
jgi:CRISPR associated protein Cas1